MKAQQVSAIVWIVNVVMVALIVVHVLHRVQAPNAAAAAPVAQAPPNATVDDSSEAGSGEVWEGVNEGVSVVALIATSILAAAAGVVATLKLRPVPHREHATGRALHPMYTTPPRHNDGGAGGTPPRARQTSDATVQTAVQRIHHTPAQTPIEWTLPPSADEVQPIFVPVPQLTTAAACFEELEDAYVATAATLLSEAREHLLYLRNMDLIAQLGTVDTELKNVSAVSEDRGARLRQLEVSSEGIAQDVSALEADKRDLSKELSTVRAELMAHIALVQEKSIETESAKLRANKALRELDEKLSQIVDLRRQLQALRYERSIESESRDFGPPEWMPKAPAPDFTSTPASVQSAVERYLTQRAILKT